MGFIKLKLTNQHGKVILLQLEKKDEEIHTCIFFVVSTFCTHDNKKKIYLDGLAEKHEFVEHEHVPRAQLLVFVCFHLEKET